MGAGRRREEEKLCPLCIEPLDPHEKTHFPCPCGYQVCVFCLDRLKKEYGNRCPGCRTEYGSNVDPFAKRAQPSSAVATPASGVAPSSSPAVAPAAAAPPSAALTPLEQARHMHRAAQLAKRQAAAVHPASQTAATHGEAASQGVLQQGQQQQHQRQRQQQQAHTAFQAPQLSQAPLLSARDVVVQPPRTMSAAGLASLPPLQQPIGNSPHSSATASGPPASQPAVWLGPGGSFASRAGGNGGQLANGMPCSSDGPSPGAGNVGHTAHALQYAETGGSSNNSSPWGNGRVSSVSGGQQQVVAGLPQRTAIPLQPLPVEGGPAAAADPGAEADLARARLAVQCGQLSASDAAWKLLSAHASLRTS